MASTMVLFCETAASCASIAMELEPKDGRILVFGTENLSTTAFTKDGIENLRALVDEYKRQQ